MAHRSIVYQVCILALSICQPWGLSGCKEPVLIGSQSGGGDGGGGQSGGASAGDAGNGGGGAQGSGGTGSGGGTTSSGDTLFPDPPEGSFPCGASYCMAATHYCKVNVDGPCCGSSEECAPLPAACEMPGATCGCFVAEPCPCGLPELCNGTECAQDAETGGLQITCLHP